LALKVWKESTEALG